MNNKSKKKAQHDEVNGIVVVVVVHMSVGYKRQRKRRK